MLLASCAKAPLDSQPMPSIELSRYMGKWYEIARLPNLFEQGCAGVTAEYALQKDGSVSVLNTCRKDTPQGPARSAKAKAWSVDPSNSRFEVSFFRPFKAPYWVIALEPDYRWALVGHPKRSYLWLLSRVPKMAEADEKAAFAEAARLGYDLTRVEKTPQQGHLPAH